MKDPERDLSRRIAAALARIERVTRAAGDRAAQELGLSALQARALEAIVARPARRIGEVARELLVTDGTLSAALSTLETKGLVTKRPDPAEHRAVLVEPTAMGRREARRLAGWPDDSLAPVVDELGLADAGALLSALLGLILALERNGRIDPVRMCFTCEHFRPWQGERAGRGARPHYCALLGAAIGGAELQVDCPDHVPVLADEREERCARLRRPRT